MYDSRPTEPYELELPEECPVCYAPNADEDGVPTFGDTIHCSEDCARHTKYGTYSWCGIDYARYEGDQDDGVFYSVGRGPGGWYLTLVADYQTLCEDDGPYLTEEDAWEAGRCGATDWCTDNNVALEDEDEDPPPNREVEGWSSTLQKLL